MSFSVIRQSLSGTLVLFCLLLGLFAVGHWYGMNSGESGADWTTVAPLGLLLEHATMTEPWLDTALALFFALATAISVTRLISRNLVFAVRTHTFLPLVAIVGFGLFWGREMAPAAAAMFFIARGSEYFASSFRRTSKSGDLFGGGFMLGLAPLVYAPAAIFLTMIPLAMSIYMRSWRESALAVAGVLLPSFAVAYATWALGGHFMAIFRDAAAILMTQRALVRPPLPTLVAMGAVVLCTVISLGSLAMERSTIRTRALRIHSYMVCLLVVAGVGFALTCSSWADLPLAAVPVGVVTSSWFSRHEGLVPNILYLLIILSAVVANI